MIPFFRCCFVTFGLLSSMGSASAENATWQKVFWHDEPAWESRQGELKAIVSESRSRVIYFGAAEADTNLLSAPHPRPTPTPEDVAPNWGGHRFWLGPQSRWKWPPLKEWEFAEASTSRVVGSVLHLVHSQQDAAYPQLEREYAWESGKLRCSVRWRGGAQPFYGMHVFAVDTPAEIAARLHAWELVPQGVVGINGDNPGVHQVLPHPAVLVEDDQVRIRSGVTTAKLGFYPQALVVRRGDRILRLLPGPVHGIPVEAPDHGYLSQAWVGRSHVRFCELEQLTPYLLPAEDGWCGSTVFLEATAAQ